MKQDWKTLRQVLWFQRRPLIWSVGVVALSAVVLFTVAWPQWQGRAALLKQDQKVTGELEQLRKRAQLVQDVSEERKKQYAVAEKAAPVQKLPLSLLRSLELMAQNSQLVLGKYDLSPGVISTDSTGLVVSQKAKKGKQAGAGSRESLELQMEVVGTFTQVTEFIASIEDALPLFSVLELGIEPAKKGGEFINGQRRYTVLVSLESYYFPLDAKKLAQQIPLPLSPLQQTAESRIAQAKYWLSTSPLTLPKDYQNANIFGVLGAKPPESSASAQSAAGTLSPPESVSGDNQVSTESGTPAF